MAKKLQTDRKQRILDAAEKGFGKRGFEGASLRWIVEEARVNLATVYYYFGSKEGLLAAVFSRRFGPLRQEHLGLLKQFEAERRGGPLPVEKIIEAMIAPPLVLAATAPGKSRVVLRLIGRIVAEPNAQMRQLLRRQFSEVRQAFLSAFQRSLPELPLADLCWRYEFVWGALAFTLSNPHKLEKEAGGVCNPRDAKTMVSQMVGFFAPGFRAPPISARGQNRCGCA